MKGRYINPYTDFGFKKLFGEETNKDLLIDFLNQLLPQKHQIEQLDFRNTENFADLVEERKAIFDIYCQTASGERIVVEMQKAAIDFFKERSVFYTTFPIREQIKRGSRSYQLDQIYFIAILDFYYDEEKDKAKLRRDVLLKDQDCEVFFDKLRYIYLQMPAFKKSLAELETRYDKWLYFLQNLQDLDHIPSILREPIFEKAFDVAEVSNYNADDRERYEKSLLDYIGLVEVVDSAERKGQRQGHLEKNIEVIKNGLAMGLSVEQLATLTGLVVAEVERLIRIHKLHN